MIIVRLGSFLKELVKKNKLFALKEEFDIIGNICFLVAS